MASSPRSWLLCSLLVGAAETRVLGLHDACGGWHICSAHLRPQLRANDDGHAVSIFHVVRQPTKQCGSRWTSGRRCYQANCITICAHWPEYVQQTSHRRKGSVRLTARYITASSGSYPRHLAPPEAGSRLNRSLSRESMNQMADSYRTSSPEPH